MSDREEEIRRLLERLEQIDKRLQEIADLEARGAIFGSGASDGRLDGERERLINEAREILDRLDKEIRDKLGVSDREERIRRLWERLEKIRKRIQEIADSEAHSARVGSGASDGGLDAGRERLINEAWEILDKLDKEIGSA